jgi:hypothetical protein
LYFQGVKGKGKAILTQALTGPDAFRRLRLPEFLDSQHMKVAGLFYALAVSSSASIPNHGWLRSLLTVVLLKLFIHVPKTSELMKIYSFSGVSILRIVSNHVMTIQFLYWTYMKVTCSSVVTARIME